MQTYQPSLIARHDTLLGICEAVGQDLGFNPLWLRAGIATMLFFSLGGAIAVYLSLGVLVLASRLLFPAPRKAVAQDAAPAEIPAVEAAPVAAQNDELPLAVAA